MAKKKIKKISIPKIKRLAAPPQEDGKFPLPLQNDGQLDFLDTSAEQLVSIAKPGDFRDKLVQNKVKFVQETHELAARFGANLKVRVYFTLQKE